VVADPEAAEEQRPDPGQGPAVGREAGGQGAAPQGPEGGPPLARGETRRAAGVGPAPQAAEPSPPAAELLGPLPDGLGGDAQAPGDGPASEATGSEEPAALEPPLLPLAGSKVAGLPHTTMLVKRIT
jgi:hypothetical protein